MNWTARNGMGNMLLACGLSLALAAIPAFSYDYVCTCFNDLAWESGQLLDSISNHSVPTTHGALVEYTSGYGRPAGPRVDISITNGSVGLWNVSPTVPDNGSDAFTVFNGFVDCTSYLSWSTGTVWITITNLIPSWRYDVALYGNRGANTGDYTSRWTQVVISDADSFTNRSSAGAVRFRTTTDNDTTRIVTGWNNQGRLFRYDNIRPGTNGIIHFALTGMGTKSTYINAFFLGGAPDLRPGLTPLAATNVTTTGATLECVLDATNGTPTDVWLLWGRQDGGADRGAWEHDVSFGFRAQGTMTTNLTGLDPQTLYYFRYGASNQSGEGLPVPTYAFRTVTGGVHYVSTNGGNVAPFCNWADAARSIGPAIGAAADGHVVAVSGGVYNISAELRLDRAVQVHAVDGPQSTVVDAGGACRNFYLGSTGAVVSGFTLCNGVGDGAGVFCNPGTLVERCVIVSNNPPRTEFKGGGVHLNQGGTVRNCLVTRNRAYYGGGIFCYYGGDVQSCTVVDNEAPISGSGVCIFFGGRLENSIVYFNTSATPNVGSVNSAWGVSHCCMTPFVAGEGNTTNPPSFVSRGAGDYRLISGSTGINVGSNAPWMSATRDIYGNPRVTDGLVDIGAHELNSLYCTIHASAGTNRYPIVATYTAEIGGGNTNGVWYRWDINGDGHADVEGSTCSSITHSYTTGGVCGVMLTISNAVGELATARIQSIANIDGFRVSTAASTQPLRTTFSAAPEITNWPGAYYSWDFDNNGVADAEGFDLTVVDAVYPEIGTYDVRLTAQPAAGGSVTHAKLQYVRSTPATVYVSPAGTSTHPFTNWTSAAASLQEALDCGSDGMTIIVGPGVYYITNQISVLHSTHILSTDGADATVIDGQNVTACLRISQTNSIVDGLTLRNGYGSFGGAVLLEGGTLRNCTIVSNQVTGGGGGVWVPYLCKGSLVNCRLLFNRAGMWGGGVGTGTDAIGSLRNVLVAGNSADEGGGLYNNVEAESTTITENQATTSGGGTKACRLLNCVVWNNQSAGTHPNHDGTVMRYTSTSPATNNYWSYGNREAEPEFRDPESGDFRLGINSGCGNAGETQGWMADGIDLGGLPRLVGEQPDLGCHEISDFRADFACSVPDMSNSLTVAFRSWVTGTNVGVVDFRWDFNGDGLTDLQGHDAGSILHSYAATGHYSVGLTVVDDAGRSNHIFRTAWVYAGARTLYVSLSGANVPPYTSRETAARTIQSALEQSIDGDRVLVAPGVYTTGYVTVGSELRTRVAITNRVVVQSEQGAATTVIAGEGSPGETAMRCAYVGDGARLVGFHLRNGHTIDGEIAGGGALCIGRGEVAECFFSECSATHHGGALHGGVAIGCVFSNNTAGANGGAAYECTLYDAYVVTNTAPVGGGIGECRAYNSTFRRNRTLGSGSGQGLGGAAYNSVVRDSQILDNYAYKGGGTYGGATSNSLYAGNSAMLRGAACYQGRLYGCRVVSNSSSITVMEGVTVINCEVGRNGGSYGLYAGVAYNSTFVLLSRALQSVVAVNCIMWSNAFSSATGNNLTACSEETDPRLANVEAMDLRLLPDSPCIDVGVDLTADDVDRDIAGNRRSLDGDANGVAAFDLGAREFVHASADSDQDGQSDLDEALAGTDPGDASELFLVRTALKNESVVFSWPAVSGAVYRVDTRTNLMLGSWAEAFSVTSMGASVSATNMTTGLLQTYIRARMIGRTGIGQGNPWDAEE